MNTQSDNIKVEYKYFVVVAMIFVASLLISNIAAQKLFSFGPFVFSCGILLFPLSYIFGDVLTEVYGYARSRLVIWVGLFCNLLMIITLQISIWLPPAPGWEFQSQFETTLGLIPRIVMASVVAYWAGEFANSYVLAKMKVWTEGKKLWLRTITSTVVGQGVDTVIFALVAFYGILPTSILLATIVSGYLFKVIYEVLVTPLTYAVVNFLKKKEGIDVYDTNTNFNPFSLKEQG